MANYHVCTSVYSGSTWNINISKDQNSCPGIPSSISSTNWNSIFFKPLVPILFPKGEKK